MSSATAAPGGTRLIDPKTLLRIRSLELRARAVVEGFLTGIHRSPYHGYSAEFTEYRAYSEGDDPRHLDWRVFARSDRYYIRKFEEETNLRFQLVVDQSRSMNFGSGDYNKAKYAATLAGTLAYFVYQQGDAVGLVTFEGELRDTLPVSRRTGHLRRVLEALERPPSGLGTDVTRPLEQVARLLRQRGMIVMVSDFLAPIDTWEKHLSTLRAMGHEVAVFQVLDPKEVTFDYRDAMLFEDMESGRTLYLDPAVIRQRYQTGLAAHQTALREIAAKLGVDFYSLQTNQPLDVSTFEYLQQRLKRSRVTRRNGPG